MERLPDALHGALTYDPVLLLPRPWHALPLVRRRRRRGQRRRRTRDGGQRQVERQRERLRWGHGADAGRERLRR
jgi:hypothetical protein